MSARKNGTDAAERSISLPQGLQ
ncbi:MAG: hypothetical protein Q605_AUC00859G0001, partial [Actinomyces urogenitalis DORA_12]